MPNAKIIFLLMVMFASAQCQAQDYVLTLKCESDKTLHISSDGKVSAEDISLAQNITITGEKDSVFLKPPYRLTLYSKEAGKYLCFNKNWKLVGMKYLKDSCYFYETMANGYVDYKSAVDRSHRVGFTKRLKLIRAQRKQDLNGACFHFMSIPWQEFSSSFPVTDVDRKKAAATKVTKKRRNHQRPNKTNGHNSTLGNSTSINNNSNLSQTTNNNNNSRSLQPKILVRHHHDNSSIVARRRQHQREQKIRQRRKYNQNQDNILSSTNLSSAKSSSAMLAPSMLNIVATLAASQRTRGRRKNGELREDDEGDETDEKVEKQKKISSTSSTNEPSPMYLSPKTPEHRHRHHHQNHLHNYHGDQHYQADDASRSSDFKPLTDSDVQKLEQQQQQRKSTATSGLLQFQNEYSNKNSNTNNINNNNYLAIPALPKNLYNNNRMTEYVYSGSTNLNANPNLNNNNHDNDSINLSSSSNSNSYFTGSHSNEINVNNNYNTDNNFKDYLNTTKNKDNANRKNLFEAIKNSNNKNKIKNIVQYRYAVSFISKDLSHSSVIFISIFP